jgi:hypothetical protein
MTLWQTLALAGFAVAFLSSSSAETQERFRPDRSQVCTREYAPVCATGRGGRRTFSNDCVARSEGFRVVHRGQCRGQGADRPQACPMIYAPVCARRGLRVRTFGNSCQARADGYRVVRRGRC